MTSVPFNTVGFVLCPYKHRREGETRPYILDLNVIAKSRKLLHFISNEFVMKDKVILLILNVIIK